jgi:hypothetical protein
VVTKTKPVVVGVDDHRGWAYVVSVALHGGRAVVVNRRRIELIDPRLPTQPHHHEAQGLALGEARALVRRVTESIEASCRSALRTLAEELAGRGYRPVSMAIRAVPETPDDLRAVLENQAASIAADAALYLRGLAGAAAEVGCVVRPYVRRDVGARAARALGIEPAEVPAFMKSLGEGLGPPWRQEHRSAAAAAIGALERRKVVRLRTRATETSASAKQRG